MPTLDSPVPAEASTGGRALRGSAWRAAESWHLFSLDAPSVAIVWCAAFARASAATTPHLGGTVVFLGLATWLCYVGDRVLDARSSPEPARLRGRHLFYGSLWRRHRLALLTTLGIAASACTVVGFRSLSLSLLERYVAVVATSLVYFASVHRGRRRLAVVSKEAAVGVIFALGCVLPAWSASPTEARLRLAPHALLFAVLCWFNCVAIERWEGRDVLSPRAHRSTARVAGHLGRLLALAAVASAGLALSRRGDLPQALLASSLAMAFMLLGALEASRRRLSTEALRVLADAVLLTPLPWLAIGLAHR